MALPTVEQCDANSPVNELLMNSGIRQNLGDNPIGALVAWEDFSGTLDVPEKYMEADGSVCNEANYNAGHSTTWDDDIGTTVLDGETLPNINTTEQIVILKDVKSQNTFGGQGSSGSWNTRTLNTTENTQTWCSLSSNQFTLDVVEYEIESSSPVYQVLQHQAKLRNITDSTDDIIGTSGISYLIGTQGKDDSQVKGIISIAAQKTFEIQHFINTSSASTADFGIPANKTSEVYTVVRIRKIGNFMGLAHKVLIKIV